MPSRNQIRPHLLFGIFALSGFAGLIYQSVWSHYLGLFLGHAAYAQALVLSIFMGGMAVGAALVARAGERWRNLIRRYALVELVIGVLGLVFHGIYVSVLGWSYDTLMPALGQPWSINAYKWLLGAALILPQTILLGMTFPLMSGGVIRRFPGRDGVVLGHLYFTNSIGAAIGVLIAAFVLLPRIGLPGAMITAGIVNLLVAGLAWRLGTGYEQPISSNRSLKASATSANRRLLKIVLVATFCSGAASFVYEIVWVRMLSLAVGNTLHAFELMLASFIAGIALGGLWIRHRAERTKNAMRLVGLIQVLMGMAALASLVLYAHAFNWVGFLIGALSPTDDGYTLFNLGTAAIAILIMMPAAFFAGATLPLFTLALLRDGQGEPSIGRVYAWNTLGAIVGVVAAIHFLIPVFGLKHALAAAALVDMLIGLTLLGMCGDASRRPLAKAIPAAAVIMSLALAMLVPFDTMRLSSGVYRWGKSYLPENDEILFYRDGKTASISVIARNEHDIRIATNGKVDASIRMNESDPPSVDEPTMVLAAALPLAYRPEARHAAVIGFGSGLTTHALLADPGLSTVDTIEIEQAMVVGARQFEARTTRAYSDPRSNIVIDDAKSFFAGAQKRYDIIISEPSNPWVTGVGALFSKEFYEYIPRFLTDDGVLLQWLQLYEIDDALVSSVINAMIPSFADYRAYLSTDNDLLLVASPSELPGDVDFTSLFQGEMAEELDRVGIRYPEQLSFRQVADARLLRTFARMRPTRPNSDYFPILSLEAPRTRFRKDMAKEFIDVATLDFPILEWIGVRGPIAAHIPVGISEHFQVTARTEVARTVANLLIDPDSAEEAETTSSDVKRASRFVSVIASCDDLGFIPSTDLIAEELLWLTRVTLPYLSVEQQHGVLIDGVWETCAHLSDDLISLAALLNAHAKRDAIAMEKYGRSWLMRAGERTRQFNAFDKFALTGIRVALIHQGHLQEAVAVGESFVHLNRNNGNDQFSRIEMLLDAWLEED